MYCGAAQCSAVQCSAVRCSAVQCSAVRCGAVQCSAVQCSAVQCSAVQCSAVQCSAVQCSAVQCSAVQCGAVQCSVVQYSTVQFNIQVFRFTGLTVECASEQMIAYLYHIDSKSLQHPTLLDKACSHNSNGTHVWFNVPFDRCMTKNSTENNTITYENSIIVERSFKEDPNIIRRRLKVKFPFNCSYAVRPSFRNVGIRGEVSGNSSFCLIISKGSLNPFPLHVFHMKKGILFRR